MDTTPSFWNETHPLSAACTALTEELVPSEGNCATIEGEILRAANRITYDWYNNGFGCNNWSGAIYFLEEYLPMPKELEDHVVLLMKLSTGAPVPYGADKDITLAVEALMERAVQYVMAFKGAYHENTEDLDLFDFSSPDYEGDDEDEDEDMWRSSWEDDSEEE